MTHRSEDLHRDRRAGLVPGFTAYDRLQEAAAGAAPEAATPGAPPKAPAKKAPAKKAPAKAAAAKKAR